MDIDAACRSEPPVPAGFVVTREGAIVVQLNAALPRGPFLDAFEVKGSVLFHLTGVASRKALSSFPGLVGEKARVHGRELERDRFCPAQVNDASY
jgi:hypothetical protein